MIKISKVFYEDLLYAMDLLKHQCPFCGNYFANKSSLSNHIESVHEGKTFQCQFCEKKFAQKSILKTHIESM